MNVVKHIICELTGYRPGSVDVSQGDRRSRAVSCRLLENGAPWMIPEGATARVAYTLPDGTEGLYDALPDGSPAGEIIGNIVTVELADQLMAQAGMAQVSILVIGPEGGQLATWPIRVMVTANKAARLTVPEEMPPYGAGFAGKIFFGGEDGTVTPLEVGAGAEIVRQDDGTYALVVYGGAGGGGIQEESDPTVPAWAKQPQKPSYTAQEVGALPAETKIPAKTTDLTNDAGYATEAWVQTGYQPKGNYLTTAPVTSVNGKTGAVSLKAADVGAMSPSEVNGVITNALDEAKKSGEFNGADGSDGRGIKSIARTSGNGAAGTVDTYTITYTDNTESTYQVRNGATGPQGPAYKLTDADKATITAAVIEGLPKYAGEVEIA